MRRPTARPTPPALFIQHGGWGPPALLGDDDVLVWREEVGDELRSDVETAVDYCPMAAISIEE